MIQTNKIFISQGKTKTQMTLQKSSNTSGQKHSLNNRTVHFHTQLKKTNKKKSKTPKRKTQIKQTK